MYGRTTIGPLATIKAHVAGKRGADRVTPVQEERENRMPTYVIGDIHGRLKLLDQLIENVPWDVAHNKIVFLGDIIDRGNDAPGVVNRVIELVKSNPNIVVLRGNHEQMLLDCLDYGDL